MDVYLFSRDLLSSHGFNDGDTPGEWYEYCERAGLAPPGGGYPRFPLAEAIRTFLLPRLVQDVRIVEVGTSHNPVRAVSVDGHDVQDWWYASNRSGAPQLTPAYVEVSMEEIARLVPRGMARSLR